MHGYRRLLTGISESFKDRGGLDLAISLALGESATAYYLRNTDDYCNI